MGYWKIRGLYAPIKYMLEYLDVEYEEVLYDQGDAPEYSRESWYSVKQSIGLDFPNLPYMIHGDLRITESQAIIRYICNKFAPDHFTGKDAHDKAIVDMMYALVFDIRMDPMIHFYYTGDIEAIKKNAFDRFPAVAEYISKRQYVAGDYVTFVDFFLWEQIELFKFATSGELLQRLPVLSEYHARIASLPRFAEYVKSDKFMVTPFNSKIAKVNN